MWGVDNQNRHHWFENKYLSLWCFSIIISQTRVSKSLQYIFFRKIYLKKKKKNTLQKLVIFLNMRGESQNIWKLFNIQYSYDGTNPYKIRIFLHNMRKRKFRSFSNQWLWSIWFLIGAKCGYVSQVIYMCTFSLLHGFNECCWIMGSTWNVIYLLTVIVCEKRMTNLCTRISVVKIFV